MHTAYLLLGAIWKTGKDIAASLDALHELGRIIAVSGRIKQNLGLQQAREFFFKPAVC
jgi:hypothetical protein